MAGDLLTVNDLTWGLNLTLSTNIPDNNLTIAKNMYYNKDKQLETRRGLALFWNSIGNSPITSMFFMLRDDTLARVLVCFAWSWFYKYNESTNNWDLVRGNLHEFETLPGHTTERTRRDCTIYKNSMYFGNWVDPYFAYDGINSWLIGMWAPVTFTLDASSDTIEKVAHGLSNGDEVQLYTTGTFPAGITAYDVYYVVNKTVDDFQISTTLNWTAITFTTTGTWTLTYSLLWQPRLRYIEYLGDRLFWAWDDANPSTLYYTAAAPSDWNNIAANAVLVGWDDNSYNTGISELGNIILTQKNNKRYSVNVATPSASPIDPQWWGYANRCIANVGNTLVYFSEKGIESVRPRYGVTGGAALEWKSISDNLRRLTDKVTAKQYNSGTALNTEKLNNYYFSFDTNDDNVPDTTLVYSSLVWGWTQYNWPNLYHGMFYIDSDGEVHYLIGSGVTWQAYEVETGFFDLWEEIEHEIETKRFDYKTPGDQKMFEYAIVVWYKDIGSILPVKVKIDWDVETESFITDAMINYDSATKTIGSRPIGTEPLTGFTNDEEITLYQYTIKVPMYTRWSDIAVNVSSTWWTWIVDKMRIKKENEPEDVFMFNNIG